MCSLGTNSTLPGETSGLRFLLPLRTSQCEADQASCQEHPGEHGTVVSRCAWGHGELPGGLDENQAPGNGMLAEPSPVCTASAARPFLIDKHHGPRNGKSGQILEAKGAGDLGRASTRLTGLEGLRVTKWRRKWQPTPVFLPGESQGRGSLLGTVYGVTQSWTRLK